MHDDPDPDDPRALADEQARRAAVEAREQREAEAADAPVEAHAHERRAEKAAYLRDKLDEADRAAHE